MKNEITKKTKILLNDFSNKKKQNYVISPLKKFYNITLSTT